MRKKETAVDFCCLGDEPKRSEVRVAEGIAPEAIRKAEKKRKRYALRIARANLPPQPEKSTATAVLFSTKCSAFAEREEHFVREARCAREVCLRHDMRNT